MGSGGNRDDSSDEVVDTGPRASVGDDPPDEELPEIGDSRHTASVDLEGAERIENKRKDD